ncbi:ribosome 60S biogenesis N-terminal-domain-containing protein, partial [Cerioporus squamosus]
MPVRDVPPPHKKRKYKTSSEIRHVFKAQSEAGLVEGLTALRNQLTVKPNEPPVQANDDRLLLAKAWLDEDPGAQELFSVWESANSRQMSLLTVIVGLFSALINVLSTHYTYHVYAQPILRTLLSQQWSQLLNQYLAGQHTDLVLAALKLYNSLTSYGGGRERKAVLDAFAWEMKSLPKLLHMRRKSKGGEDVDMLARPDIRTLYLLFILSFVDTTSPSSVKVAFLEQHRDAFTAIFKGLWQDSYSVIRRVLEVCWSGLWSDPKLKRTLKIQVFSESTCRSVQAELISALPQLLRLYDRNAPEGPDAESVPADVVHHFLLALCSRRGLACVSLTGVGIPARPTRDSVAQATTGDGRTDVDSSQKGGKIYNKILANVVKTLKVNEDPRQQELALKILSACPELVSGYWASAGLALEPRLSSKWLANIAFFGAVVSLPVPTTSFFLPESGSTSTSLYRPSPPPLSTIVDNILPTAHIKTHLSRGLQSSSPLVQHASALALAKCLLKYEQVVQSFEQREVRKRVPDFQVIVGFSQKYNDPNSADQEQSAPNPTRTALLAESAHRLLWLYHELLPSVVAEARFDAGKLLQAIEDMLAQGSSSSRRPESEHFTWSGKSGSKHGNFYILLKAYIVTSVPAVRSAIVALLRHILAPGVLFQHDPDEITLWLDALPLTQRSPAAKAPDGTPLTDEGDSVISFLDDCVQRCVKTPYKYVEELQALYSTTTTDGDASAIGARPEAFPSPLLATVIEQLGAKLRGRLLTPSDALALFTFVRKLVVLLVGKTSDLALISALVKRINGLVGDATTLFAERTIVEAALTREVALLASSSEQLLSPIAPKSLSSTPDAEEYVTALQELFESSGRSQRDRAYEVVDWLRLKGQDLSTADVTRLLESLERLYKPALKEFCQYLNPREVSLWEGANLPSDHSRIADEISFETLFLHCTHEHIRSAASQQTMVDSLLRRLPDVAAVKRGIRLILHRLSNPAIADEALRDWSLVLAEVVNTMRNFGSSDVQDVAFFCVNSETTTTLSGRSLGDTAREGFDKLLTVIHQAGGDDVAHFFAETTARWVSVLRESLDNTDETQRDTALMWFKYLSAQDVIDLLQYFAERADHYNTAATREMIDAVLTITSDTLSSHLGVTTQALPLLCRLQTHIPQSAHLTALIASAIQGSLPLAHDGFFPPPPPFSEWTVASVTPSADKRWSLRLQPTPPIAVQSLLSSEHLSDSAVDIATSLLYRQPSARSLVLDWLGSPASKGSSTPHLVKLLFALYDSDPGRGRDDGETYDSLQIHLSRLIRTAVEARHSREICVKASKCVVWMTASSHSRAKCLKALNKEITSTPPEQLRPYILLVGTEVLEQIGTDARALAEDLLDLGLKWAVRHFADCESSSDDDRRMLVSLASLMHSKVAVKSHLAEPVIAAVVQDRLSNGDAVRFARLLAASAHLKPVTVNRFLQSVVQHAKFYDYCANTDGLSSREDIVHFLHTLFHLHPTNTCQPSHIEPLRRTYGGSLSHADLRILSIFQLFETTRKTSVASLFGQWSMAGDVSSNSALEAIQSLDPSRVLKTCLEYPDWRKLADVDESRTFANDGIYDPVFILLLFAQMLADSCTFLFRTNVVSLILRTLSAKGEQLRDVAWGQVAALYRALEHADLQEKPHVLHILNLLKDLAPSAPPEEPVYLPAYTTLLLAHAFRGIFYPSNFSYPLTARFLLQRPTLDPSDVPMLYGMLYSASDDWKKERAWIVRFLSDGIVGNAEWKILKRRHT